MVVDQPTSDFLDQEVLNAVGTDLSSQSDNFPKLDVQIDEFWSRLRAGYAHDPTFKSPCTKHRFDKHFQVYFYGHRLVTPDHDHLREQILHLHHTHPWHAHVGMKRTHALLAESFFRPHMSEDVKHFVTQCHSCQVMKSQARLKPWFRTSLFVGSL